MMNDQRLHYPATARNRDPILAVLRQILPPRGLVLEIASGSGEHIVHFAEALPHLDFQPSDPITEAVQSIDAWRQSAGLANIRPALTLDAAAASWPVEDLGAVLCINMIHISPWEATEGLMRNAAACLPAGAPLYLYGPYKRGGRHTAASNEDFDANLKARDPRWGVRDLEAVAALAAAAGFSAPTVTEMPANNLSLVFRHDG
ncbi:DUF938 domain-containing protein [Dongia soli]|uniref:DUF938 domain-containing protein n=1 Tax=Dongia soli TaxID=600628 RepID=A0ABU5EE07_9PROT|nr:DUF938 domain-containing protein [Dongia soli]MDY0884590.1 DUF938 domain-containing protein [Dongia soli]